MKILLSGSHGLIGSALSRALIADKHEIVHFVREGKSKFDSDIVWNPKTGIREPGRLKGITAVVHLAGEPIAGRWTWGKKAAIRDSRLLSTSYLSRAIADAPDKPETFLCASAVGIYGDRGAQILTEPAPPGTGFLPELCREWEAATQPAAAAGVRVVNLRFGAVLSPKGGMLKAVLPAFRWGVGGKFGSGQQYLSWITLDDAISAIRFLLQAKKQGGPVNVTSPHPVANAEFARALGVVVDRPAFIPVPRIVLQALLGEFANEALLASARVVPARLSDAGFKFKFPDLEPALKYLLDQEE